MIDKAEKIEASKGPKSKLKRKVKASDSCIRTDLLRLSPNDGKAAWLAGLFKAYRDACSQMMAAAWADWQAGRVRGSSDALWKIVSPPNPLASNSTVLQPAERSVKAALESHTGWLARDVSDAIRDWLDAKLKDAKKPEEESQARSLVHDLRSINKAKAWKAFGAARAKALVYIRKFGKDGEPSAEFDSRAASDEAYEIASALFDEAAKGRNLPDSSGFQVEATRGGASLRTSGQITAGDLSLLGIEATLEKARSSLEFPYWLRLRGPKLDGSGMETVLVPALAHRAFHLRNRGRKGPHHGKGGHFGYPGWDALSPEPKKLRGKAKKEAIGLKEANVEQAPTRRAVQAALNPGSFAPQAVESIGVLMKIVPCVASDGSASAKPEFHAAVRSEMSDSFAASKPTYASAQQERLTRTGQSPQPIGIDFGIKHLIATSRPVEGSGGNLSRLHGSSLMRDAILPKLRKAFAIESARRSQLDLMIEATAAEIVASQGLSIDDAKRIARKERAPNFPIRTPQSSKLRASIEGSLKSFFGAFFNRLAETDMPSEIIVEELNFQGSELSPEMNSMLANCGRSAFEAKLKDLHEKFGIGIGFAESAYTSQESVKCGHVDAKNRTGESFKCVSCGHRAHADEHAAEAVLARRPCPSTSRLSKGAKGFSKKPQGSLPMLPRADWEAARNARIFHPRLRAWIQARAQEKKAALPPAS